MRYKKAIEKNQPYIELNTSYTVDDNDFKEQLLNVIDRVNSENESAVLSRSFRSFNADTNGHKKTTQIYYLVK